jgi:hypothetical protein
VRDTDCSGDVGRSDTGCLPTQATFSGFWKFCGQFRSVGYFDQEEHVSQGASLSWVADAFFGS